MNLQDNDNLDLVNSCLTGITYAIRIACIFHLEVCFHKNLRLDVFYRFGFVFQLERNAFIQALTRFTLLMVTSQVIDIKAKNLACVRTLLSIAQTDGNYLDDAWYDVSKRKFLQTIRSFCFVFLFENKDYQMC